MNHTKFLSSALNNATSHGTATLSRDGIMESIQSSWVLDWFLQSHPDPRHASIDNMVVYQYEFGITRFTTENEKSKGPDYLQFDESNEVDEQKEERYLESQPIARKDKEWVSHRCLVIGIYVAVIDIVWYHICYPDDVHHVWYVVLKCQVMRYWD